MRWSAFLEAVRAAFPVREQYGFGVEFALVDEERNEFTWAVSHDGDFAAAEAAYYASPERAALPANPADFIDVMHLGDGAGRAALTLALDYCAPRNSVSARCSSGRELAVKWSPGTRTSVAPSLLGERARDRRRSRRRRPRRAAPGRRSPSTGAGPTDPGART